MQEKRVVIKFVEDELQLAEMLDAYRKSLGWTWKRFFLVGVGEAIGSNKDNPDLVMAVVDYLKGKR